MALTYGFYNSIEGDRVYDAIQFGRIFDGIIKDGVYATYEKGMMVIASSNPGEVIIQPGRAWFNHTWSYNDANVIFEAPAPEVLLERIDALVLEVNEELSSRENSYKWVQGTPSSRPVRPTLTNTATIHQYPLCYVRRYPETTMIYTRDITNMIGTSECPFATGVLEGIDLDAWINQWNDEFHNWENTTKNEFNNWETTTKNEFEAWMLNQEDVYTAWFTALRSQMDSDVQEVEDFVEYLESVLDASTAAHLQQEIDDLKTEITAGSQITVTTLNAELYNRNVTITEPGGTVITEKFNSSGVAEFKSVPYVGDLTIESTYGQQTASKVVNTPYYARYAFEIAFWAATVNIISDAEFAGQSVTVRDSNQAIVGTVVLDNTGAGVYTAIKPDTYKFTLTYGGETMEVTLSVTQETTYTVELHSKAFDYEDWLEAGGVTGTYADLDAVLTDEVALRRLFTVHASVDYMAAIDEENEDVEKIINNDLCAKWINLRDYALDTLYANTVIKGYMDTADKYGYGEWALVGQVPKMTSNTAPYGVASASGEYSSTYKAYMAFDSDSSTYWASANGEVTNQYLIYEGTTPYICKRVKCKGQKQNNRAIKNYTIKATNGTWSEAVILYTGYNANQDDEFDISLDNNIAYSKYGLFITDIWGATDFIAIYNLQFYAWAPKGNVPIMTANNAPYGSVLVSSELYSGSVGYSAFDGKDSSMTISAVNASTFYLGYKFVNPIKVARLRLYVGDGGNYGQYAYSFNVQASNDGSNWSLLKSVSGTDGNEIIVDIPSEEQDYYLYYRLAEIKHKNNVANVSIYFNYIGTLQFYGRELKVSIPTMTSNTAPYGVASASSEPSATYQAYKVFDKNEDTFWVSTSNANQFVGYKFNSPICVRYVQIGAWSLQYQPPLKNFKIQYSNDGANYTDVYTGIVPTTASTKGNLVSFSFDNEISALYWRVFCIDSYTPQYDIQFSTLQFYGLDYSEKEFEEGATKKWLYDHGVELETIEGLVRNSTDIITENEDSLEGYTPSGNGAFKWVTSNAIDLTPYSRAFAKHTTLGKQTSPSVAAVSIDTVKSWSLASDAAVAKTINNVKSKEVGVCVDISSINQSYYIGIIGSWYQDDGNVHSECTEAWLE